MSIGPLDGLPMVRGQSAREVFCAIARHAMRCVDFCLASDQRMAASVRSPSTGSHQFFGEETITENLVASLLQEFPSNIDVTLFTKPEERRNGADWYWRIQHGDASLNALVQAKRVQRSAFGVADANCHVDISAEQIDRLIGAAADAGIEGLQTWLFTYGRSNATPPCGTDPALCHHHKHHGECSEIPSEASIWVAQANEVRGLGHHLFPRFVANSVRLDCLLPCLPNAWEGPQIKGFALTSGAPSFGQCSKILADVTPLGAAINISL